MENHFPDKNYFVEEEVSFKNRAKKDSKIFELVRNYLFSRLSEEKKMGTLVRAAADYRGSRLSHPKEYFLVSKSQYRGIDWTSPTQKRPCKNSTLVGSLVKTSA